MSENKETKTETKSWPLFKSIWACEGKREMTYFPVIIGVNA